MDWPFASSQIPILPSHALIIYKDIDIAPIYTSCILYMLIFSAGFGQCYFSTYICIQFVFWLSLKYSVVTILTTRVGDNSRRVFFEFPRCMSLARYSIKCFVISYKNIGILYIFCIFWNFWIFLYQNFQKYSKFLYFFII